MPGRVAVGLLCVVMGIVASVGAEKPIDETAERKIAPWLADSLSRGTTQRFFVLLRDQADARQEGAISPRDQYQRLTSLAARTQLALVEWLAIHNVRAERYWIVNAVLVEGDFSLARLIAARPDVERLVGNPRVFGLPGVRSDVGSRGVDAPEWGVAMVQAPNVWNTYGKRGEGVVVATCDTGVEWDHPALKQHYRGWDDATQTADHRYSWHDAIEDRATPLDDNDHGTHVTGTMVGDDGAGNQIGVAPGAQFIGCRNMDHGNGTPASYLGCLEWTLAPYPPGGNKFVDGRPELAPDVVNNSWGCPPSEGCDPLTLQSAFARQREAGILQIAAAGNSGPSCSTVSDPPAIYDEVLTVGAVDQNRAIALFSSRGPVTSDGSNRRKPNVSAPGDGVRSSVPGGGYATFSGTSMASPHTSGSAALLMSVKPQLKGLVRITRCLLEQSATHNVANTMPQTCGGLRHNQYPNNTSGQGLITALGALALPDGDGDGIANPCDCAATNAGAFEIPGETGQLGFAPNSKTQLVWAAQASSAGTGTRYDLLRGDVAALRAAGNIGGASCRANDLPSAQFTDPDLPAVGSASYYLVRGQNGCGSGSLGRSSAGAARSNGACS